MEDVMATVLVVDDEGEIRTSLRGVLSDEGLRVLEAEDGRRALTLVRSERPELVLLDVWMPEVDGIELLRSLQEEPDRPRRPTRRRRRMGTPRRCIGRSAPLVSRSLPAGTACTPA